MAQENVPASAAIRNGSEHCIAGRDTDRQAGPPPTEHPSFPPNAAASAGHHEAISGFGRFISSPTEEMVPGSVRIEARMVEIAVPTANAAFIICCVTAVLGSATSSARAASSASPRSLRCSLMRKPGSKLR